MSNFLVSRRLMMLMRARLSSLSFCILRAFKPQLLFGSKPHVHGILQHFREIMIIMTGMLMIFMVGDSHGTPDLTC